MRRRFTAFLIDYMIIVGYGVVLGLLSPLLSPLFTDNAFTAHLSSFFILTLPVYLYFSIFEASPFQATLGKRAAKLRVAGSVNTGVSLSRSLVRSMIKFLPWEMAHFAVWRFFLPTDLPELVIIMIAYAANGAALIYLIVPFLNHDRRFIHDWASGTRVAVKERN